MQVFRKMSECFVRLINENLRHALRYFVNSRLPILLPIAKNRPIVPILI